MKLADLVLMQAVFFAAEGVTKLNLMMIIYVPFFLLVSRCCLEAL